MSDTRVAAAIIVREGRVLAARRADNEAGGWEFPGGKVEDGETPLQALERELSEELGCSVASAWPYDTVRREQDGDVLVMDCFVTSLADGSDPARDERVHAELRWVDRNELAELDWLPADVQVAGTLAAYWDEVVVDQQL